MPRNNDYIKRPHKDADTFKDVNDAVAKGSRAEQSVRLTKALNHLYDGMSGLWGAYEKESDDIIKSRMLICYNKIMTEYEYLLKIKHQL
jgi:hypothetical protein